MARERTYPWTADEIGMEKYWNTIKNMPPETVTNMIVITPVVNVTWGIGETGWILYEVGGSEVKIVGISIISVFVCNGPWNGCVFGKTHHAARNPR